MEVTALIKGKKYLYAPPGKEPVIWTYQYETLNCWLFDDKDFSQIHLLHKQQVERDIKEIEQ